MIELIPELSLEQILLNLRILELPNSFNPTSPLSALSKRLLLFQELDFLRRTRMYFRQRKHSILHEFIQLRPDFIIRFNSDIQLFSNAHHAIELNHLEGSRLLQHRRLATNTLCLHRLAEYQRLIQHSDQVLIPMSIDSNDNPIRYRECIPLNRSSNLPFNSICRIQTTIESNRNIPLHCLLLLNLLEQLFRHCIRVIRDRPQQSTQFSIRCILLRFYFKQILPFFFQRFLQPLHIETRILFFRRLKENINILFKIKHK